MFDIDEKRISLINVPWWVEEIIDSSILMTHLLINTKAYHILANELISEGNEKGYSIKYLEREIYLKCVLNDFIAIKDRMAYLINELFASMLVIEDKKKSWLKVSFKSVKKSLENTSKDEIKFLDLLRNVPWVSTSDLGNVEVYLAALFTPKYAEISDIRNAFDHRSSPPIDRCGFMKVIEEVSISPSKDICQFLNVDHNKTWVSQYPISRERRYKFDELFDGILILWSDFVIKTDKLFTDIEVLKRYVVFNTN
ncbi:hypothetical protein BTR23_22200 [Alkalihalophilus pseudofirmus]|nr:hypothetical protein BTR23_22200 [Alkalihalophilus pseudofirmus]